MNPVPYPIIADCFRNGTIVPFLGAAASFVGADENHALPSGARLAKQLAELARYPGLHSDPLTKVAQFLEEAQADRGYLVDTIIKCFSSADGAYRSSLTTFLESIPRALIPRLIISTNYDAIIETKLRSLDVPHIAISHVVRGSKNSGRFVCCEFDPSLEPKTKAGATPLPVVRTRKDLSQRLLKMEIDHRHYVIVYKMHGTVTARLETGVVDSIVLTENDYIEFFALDLIDRIPEMIVEQLAQSHLLFLGYSLEDWNFRVLLRRINKLQSQVNDPRRHWAFLLGADEVESKFWDKRGVNVYTQSLDHALVDLLDLLKTASTQSVA